MSESRPPIRISFKYNKDTGDIVEFIIDDNSPTASEEFHNKVAEAVASPLGRRLEIQDAGMEPVEQPQSINETPTPTKIIEGESE